MDNKQLRLEIVRMILETGSELHKSNPLPIADNYYKWISKESENSPKKSKTISKQDLADKKESNQITTAFVEQYSSNIQMLSQQKGSLLRDKVRLETVVGKNAFFDQVGSVTATVRTSRHSDTPQVDTPHSRRRVSLVDYEFADLIDDLDKVQKCWLWMMLSFQLQLVLRLLVLLVVLLLLYLQVKL
jgi:hypothetical protein